MTPDTKEQLDRLDQISRIDPGFPNSFLQSDSVRDIVYGEVRTRIDGRA